MCPPELQPPHSAFGGSAFGSGGLPLLGDPDGVQRLLADASSRHKDGVQKQQRRARVEKGDINKRQGAHWGEAKTYNKWGQKLCPHDRLKTRCKDCGGGSLCEHGVNRSEGQKCGGALCEHDRRRTLCKDCGGGSLCEHDRRRTICKDCGGGRTPARHRDCGRQAQAHAG